MASNASKPRPERGRASCERATQAKSSATVAGAVALMIDDVGTVDVIVEPVMDPRPQQS